MSSSVTLINTTTALKSLLEKIAAIIMKQSPTEPPQLYFATEGIRLGRDGSISILSLFVLPEDRTYIIDICVLGMAAFATKSRQEYSLKSILEFAGIPKAFFDVRNDSLALFHLYGISLAGVQDLQPMELAANRTSNGPAPFLSSLAKCVQRDLSIENPLRNGWLDRKRSFSQHFNSNGKLFDERPLTSEVIGYCAQGVVVLPELWKTYAIKVCPDNCGFWRELIRKESIMRVQSSQHKEYDGQASGQAAGPWDAECVENAREDWNGDVMMFLRDGKLLELSFGVFQWV